MSNEKFLSLYDYLGRAAGSSLGKEVFIAAKESKVQIKSKEVSNRVYQGKIRMYPLSFLDKYFAK